MFSGINQKQLKMAMKKMGVSQQEINATEVIIKTANKEIIVRNPQVMKVKMGGEESLQITGQLEERTLEKFTEEDVKTVMEQTNKSEDEAREALENHDGNLAEAILSLQ